MGSEEGIADRYFGRDRGFVEYRVAGEGEQECRVVVEFDPFVYAVSISVSVFVAGDFKLVVDCS